MNLPNSGPILLTLLLAQTAPLLAEELFVFLQLQGWG